MRAVGLVEVSALENRTGQVRLAQVNAFEALVGEADALEAGQNVHVFLAPEIPGLYAFGEDLAVILLVRRSLVGLRLVAGGATVGLGELLRLGQTLVGLVDLLESGFGALLQPLVAGEPVRMPDLRQVAPGQLDLLG